VTLLGPFCGTGQLKSIALPEVAPPCRKKVCPSGAGVPPWLYLPDLFTILWFGDGAGIKYSDSRIAWSWELEMTESTSTTRKSPAALLAIVTLSAVTMVWLFWHYPRITAMVTIVVLAGLGISARLAGSIDSELAELRRRNQNS
jgi:hypothetical protein